MIFSYITYSIAHDGRALLIQGKGGWAIVSFAWAVIGYEPMCRVDAMGLESRWLPASGVPEVVCRFVETGKIGD